MQNSRDKLLFNTPHGLKLDTENVVREITDFIELDPKRSYKVIIGTDSEQFQKKSSDFVTAIVVHRKGRGGKYYWRRIQGGVFHTIRDRIIQEVMFSLDAAKVILESLSKQKTNPNWSFEIHVDVGENGPTKELIQEVVGMVRANNFDAKTKPDGYVASKVADKHV